MKYLLKGGDKMFQRNDKQTKLKVVRWKDGSITIDIMRRHGNAWSGGSSYYDKRDAKKLLALLAKATGGD